MVVHLWHLLLTADCSVLAHGGPAARIIAWEIRAVHRVHNTAKQVWTKLSTSSASEPKSFIEAGVISVQTWCLFCDAWHTIGTEPLTIRTRLKPGGLVWGRVTGLWRIGTFSAKNAVCVVPRAIFVAVWAPGREMRNYQPTGKCINADMFISRHTDRQTDIYFVIDKDTLYTHKHRHIHPCTHT